MSAHDDLTYAPPIGSFRHQKLKKPRPITPDVTRTTTNLFKTLRHRHLRFKLIKNRPVFPDDHLRLQTRLTGRTIPRELTRAQTSRRLLQLCRQVHCLQRRKHLRRSRHLPYQRFFTRCRIRDTVPASRIRRQDPKHRSTSTSRRTSIKKRLVPISLRHSLLPVNTHPKLTHHQRLTQRKSGRRPILDKVLQRRRRVDKTVVIVARIIMNVAIVDRRQRMVRQPLAAFRRRTITPRTRRDHVIRIERLKIRTHLRKPSTPLRPASRDHLRLVHQFPRKDRRIVAIQNPGHCISTRRQFLDMLTVEPPRFRIRIKEKRLFVVDTKLVTIIRSISNSGPTQVLRHAPRIAPPVRQTKLHVNPVLRSLRDHFVKMHKRFFIPSPRRETERMMPRPILEISANRFDVIWTTLAKRPNTHHLDACLRRPTNRLRHTLSIFVAIHHRNVRAHKSKRFIVDKETSATLPSKLRPHLPAAAIRRRRSAQKENRRASHQDQRGDKKQFLLHQRRQFSAGSSSGQNP